MMRFVLWYFLRFVAILAFALALLLELTHYAHAAGLEPVVTTACYYNWDQKVSSMEHASPGDCVSYREEAEGYFARRGWACAYTIYVLWQGPRETVRCRGFEGGTIDYVSQADGSFKITR